MYNVIPSIHLNEKIYMYYVINEFIDMDFP